MRAGMIDQFSHELIVGRPTLGINLTFAIMSSS
jgi:hypothetical protein